jgi:hypothetical protein
MEPKKDNVFECSAVVKWLEIELTSYCWMDCVVCARWDLEQYGFISFSDFKKIVSLLKEGNYSEVMVCWLWDAFIHEEVNEFMEYLFSEIPNINLFFMTKWLAIKDEHLEEILDLKNRGFNVSLTFSVFSLEEKMYNYLTWGDFYKNFMQVLNKVNKMKINYSMEFMLSVLTLLELEKFKRFAKSLWKDFWISLVHNWGWRIAENIHKKMFDVDKLKWHFIKRAEGDICEVMKYNYLYIDSFWDVFQCSLNEIDRTWFLWKLWEYSLKEFLERKSKIDYKKACEKCFYYNYKTFN